MGVCLDKEYKKSGNIASADDDDADNVNHHKGKKYFRKRSLKAKDVLRVKTLGGKVPEEIVATEARDLDTLVPGSSNVFGDVTTVTVTHDTESVLTDREVHVETTDANFLPTAKMTTIPALTKPAPDFSGTAVVNGVFKEIKLGDYKGKYLVLFFYPLDFTFVCPTEIISFSDKVDEFKAINCELIACSTDSQYSHFAWVNTTRKQGGLGSLNIPLLADKTGKIARDYGCYKEDEGIAFRGLYIIDDKGTLRQITINDLPVGRSVEETLRLVQAFQYTDKHGEVCPANWKPGAKTMKPDPTGSLEYFEKEN